MWTGELGGLYLTLGACGKVGLAYLEPPERQTSSLNRLRPGLGMRGGGRSTLLEVVIGPILIPVSNTTLGSCYES